MTADDSRAVPDTEAVRGNPDGPNACRCAAPADDTAAPTEQEGGGWNYRVVKQTHHGETLYGIHEAYYEPLGWTAEPVAPVADSVAELRDVLARMAVAPELEVIDGGEVELHRRAEAASADDTAAPDPLADTLRLIAAHGCSRFTRGDCSTDGSKRRVSFTGTADQWCDECRAHDALTRAGAALPCSTPMDLDEYGSPHHWCALAEGHQGSHDAAGSVSPGQDPLIWPGVGSAPGTSDRIEAEVRRLWPEHARLHGFEPFAVGQAIALAVHVTISMLQRDPCIASPDQDGDTAAPDVRTAIDRVLDDVRAELVKATSRFGAFASAHEGYAVIREELDELWDEVKRNDAGRAREEAVQVAAMGARFLLDVSPDQDGDTPTTGEEPTR